MEDEMWQELDKNIFSSELGKERSGSMNTKIGQMVQSSNTTAENLEHDFNEISAEIRELGWRTPEGGQGVAGASLGDLSGLVVWSVVSGAGSTDGKHRCSGLRVDSGNFEQVRFCPF